jgi:ABC-type ATPase involved in cell division
VLDHVALPLLIDGCSHRSAKRRARRALLACEAEQCIDMELGELSEGEHLRVAIARAVVSEPQMLLADGPTSSLSFIEADRIMELLSELAHKARVAVLVTARDAQALMRSDPILYLRDGELVAPEQLNEPGKLYRFPSAASHRAAADA